MYIHERKNWPDFHWNIKKLAEPLASVRYRQGGLIGQAQHPDSARCALRPGSGGSDLQRRNQRPVYRSGGVAATVQFAGLVAPGEFQFNVAIPSSLTNGDQPVTATYNGVSTQPGTLITIHK